MTVIRYNIDDLGWLADCPTCPSPNSDERPEGVEPDLLVIHNISLPPEQFGGNYVQQLFTNCLDTDVHPYFQEIVHLRVSSHLLIDREGQPTQFVSFDRRAWHAGVSSWQGRDRCNDFSIGIELEGCDSKPFTDLQYRSLIAVSVALRQRYPQISPDRLVGHSDIAPGRKTDPGPFFNWSRYRDALI